VFLRRKQTNVHIQNIKFQICDTQYTLKFKIQTKLSVLNLCEEEVFMCYVCVQELVVVVTVVTAGRSDPKFHQPLIVDGVGKSTRASFAILNKGCLFRVGLFIILRVVVVPWIH
jgi:hypothetical protein